MRGFLGVVFLLAAARGQVVPPKPDRVPYRMPARVADNAATLYSLAIAEVTRDIKSGRLKWPARPQPNARILNAGVVLAFQFGVFDTEPERPAETLQAVARSVLGRSLFRQASARPACQFGVNFAANGPGALGLKQLVRLIGWHAQQALANQPILTCEDGITLLRYVRHRRAGLSEQAGIELGEQEERALRLLHGGLEALKRGPTWREHRARFAAELDLHAQSAISPEHYRALFCRGIPELVKLHRPRLRDMHMKIAGGFDADKMTRHLEAVVAKVFATPSSTDVSFGQWLSLVNQRTMTAIEPLPETAGVTEKATLGMLQLVLMSGGPMARSIQTTTQWTEQCQQVLQLDSAPR
ncbi:MAG: hypothetical protein ACI8UD_001552 [Planctomycetota bacterium]|jgi:hypothetical protein